MRFISPPAHQIPQTQWAYEKVGQDLQCRRIAVPQPGPDQVLVLIKFSGVCRSDYCLLKGIWNLPATPCTVGGHEGAGVVVAVGEEVSDLNLGDRVGIQWVNGFCGSCNLCKAGDSLFCPQAGVSGYTINGTFQQYALCKAASAVRIPPELPLEIAAPVLCAGVTAYNAVKESNIREGEVLAVVGAGGGLGTFACQYAKACGYRVLAISSGPEKKQLCLETLGVDYFVDYSTSEDLVKEVVSLTEGGPHAAVVLSTTKDSYDKAIQYIRPTGTVMVVGAPPGDLTANFFSIATRKITIKGAYVGSRQDTEEALDVLARKKFPVQYQVAEFFELPEIFHLMEKGKIQGRRVLRIGKILSRSKSTLGQLIRPTFHQFQYNIGTFLAHRMEELGVSDYFVVPGYSNMGLIDEVLKNKALRLVGCCNELNAGYAADGYARSSPFGVAVVIVTFTVGGLSLLNAIAGAYSERLKVIVISGAPTSILLNHPVIHNSLGTSDRDQPLRMYKEVTTASVRLDLKNDPVGTLDETISQCLKDSLPVYIEIPQDLVPLPCAAPEDLQIEEAIVPSPTQLAAVVEAVSASWNLAKTPVMIVGYFARRYLSYRLLAALIEKLGCAVYCQPDSKSFVPETHPQFAGTFWSEVNSIECSQEVQESDLLIMIGSRLSDFHTLDQIDLHRDSHRILDLQEGRVKAPNGQVVTGLSLNNVVSSLIDSHLPRKEMTQQLPLPHKNDPDTFRGNHALSTANIVEGIQTILRPEDSIIVEAGDTWFNGQEIRLPAGASFHTQLLYASIGWSLPATLGCQLARPDGRAILMIGDGSFQMSAQELSTMIRMRMNPIIFIFNNLGYAIQRSLRDGPYNYIGNWNYASLAMSMFTIPHFTERENPYREQAPSTSPPIIAMQIKTTAELGLALDLVQREPEKLAVLDCCLHSKDVSPMMWRLSAGIARINQTVLEPEGCNGQA